MSKKKSKARIAREAQDAKRLLVLLRHAFPAAFAVPRPLAIGIHDAIAAEFPGAARRTIQQCLREWTRRNDYRLALAAPGARRAGLDGSDAGEVSGRDRERAIEMLGPELVAGLGAMARV